MACLLADSVPEFDVVVAAAAQPSGVGRLCGVYIRHDIGWDLSVGVTYRPLLINNIQLTFGASTLKPRRGFRDIYTDRTRNCPPNVPDYCTSDNVVINPNKPLYALFAQAKFIF